MTGDVAVPTPTPGDGGSRPTGRALPQAMWRGIGLLASREVAAVSLARRLDGEAMLAGYRRGRFPRPRQHLRALLPWYCPDPRAVLPVGEVHVGRHVRKRLRSCGWSTTIDEAFDEVVTRCARRRIVWLTADLQRGYRELHEQGAAHSLEVWAPDGRLIGGAFGVQIGGVWCGDSMFFDETGASKVAVIDLSDRLRRAGAVALECQYQTPHLASLGVTTISRSDYLELVAAQRDRVVAVPAERLPVSRLAPPR